MDFALEQWKEDRTGDWTKFGCNVNMGFFKSEPDVGIRLLVSQGGGLLRVYSCSDVVAK
jgi:hypothetical protein